MCGNSRSIISTWKPVNTVFMAFLRPFNKVLREYLKIGFLSYTSFKV
jgi:hypothetical protein